MIVQVIGLPCTGKTTALKKWLKQKKEKINYFDWADYENKAKFIQKINQHNLNKVLVESACGLEIKNSIVILYKQPQSLIYKRHELRNEILDEDYLSLLESNSMIPNYTVNNEKSLFNMLNILFY